MRIDAALRRREDRRAEHIVTFPWGAALLVERLPRVWDLNFVRVDAAPRRHGAARLAAEAERLMGAAGLAHRKLTVADDALGERLAPELAALGWSVESLVVMTRPPDAAPLPAPDADAPVAREASLDELRPLLGRVLRSMPQVRDEETVRQLLGESELTGRVADTRRFAAPGDGSDPLSACRLHRDVEGIAEIDDVGTLEEGRGRGLGNAVVRAALGAAREERRELVFLIADAHDWPRAWYRRLGFVPVGRRWAFVRSGT